MSRAPLAATATHIIVRPGPIIVHASPVTVHIAPVVHATDATATVIAVVGVVLALAALCWQAWTFYWSGSRIRVEVRSGLKSLTHAVTIPRTATADEIRTLRSQGFETPVLSVHVKNSGRGETSIADVELLFSDGGSLGSTLHEPPLPFRMPGESEQTWHFDATTARRYAEAVEQAIPSGRPRLVRGRARAGGQTRYVVSKNEVELPPGT